MAREGALTPAVPELVALTSSGILDNLTSARRSRLLRVGTPGYIVRAKEGTSLGSKLIDRCRCSWAWLRLKGKSFYVEATQALTAWKNHRLEALSRRSAAILRSPSETML
jgi:hypothetical protein